MRQKKSSCKIAFINLLLIIIATILFTISFFVNILSLRYRIIINVTAECLIALFFLRMGIRNLTSKDNKGQGVMFIIAFIIISTIIGFTINNIL